MSLPACSPSKGRMVSRCFQDGGVCSVANCLFPQGFSIGGTEKAEREKQREESKLFMFSRLPHDMQAINTLKELAEKNGALQARATNQSQ